MLRRAGTWDHLVGGYLAGTLRTQSDLSEAPELDQLGRPGRRREHRHRYLTEASAGTRLSPVSLRVDVMIRFDDVSKQYAGGTTAVDHLDLEAPTGQITVLVGPSGCGKTTTLRMVNRMIEPTSGTIWLDDQDTGKMDAAEMRRGIGYVIQHAGPLPAPHRARQRRHRARAARLGQEEDP